MVARFPHLVNQGKKFKTFSFRWHSKAWCVCNISWQSTHRTLYDRRKNLNKGTQNNGWICYYEYPEARSFIFNLWKNLADVSFLIHSITNSYNTPDGRFLDSHAWHAGKCRSAINEQGQFFGHLGRLVSRCFICGGPAQLIVVVNYVIIRRKWCKEAIQVWQMNNCQLLIRCERNWIQDLFTFLSQLLQIF